jgi:hypothetical protein
MSADLDAYKSNESANMCTNITAHYFSLKSAFQSAKQHKSNESANMCTNITAHYFSLKSTFHSAKQPALGTAFKPAIEQQTICPAFKEAKYYTNTIANESY